MDDKLHSKQYLLKESKVRSLITKAKLLSVRIQHNHQMR